MNKKANSSARASMFSNNKSGRPSMMSSRGSRAGSPMSSKGKKKLGKRGSHTTDECPYDEA